MNVRRDYYQVLTFPAFALSLVASVCGPHDLFSSISANSDLLCYVTHDLCTSTQRNDLEVERDAVGGDIDQAEAGAGAEAFTV